MRSRDLERRLREATWPEPSASLWARVRSLVVSPAPALSWVDRVWFSRAWRLSAAGVVVALVALEAWSIQAVPGRVAPARLVEGPAAQALSETERELGLPAGVFASLARRGERR